MNTQRIRYLIFFAGLVFGAIPSVFSQTVTDLNMGATMAIGDTDPPTWRFSWWGRSGRHYLVQISLDLQTWSFLPATNPSGADEPFTVVTAIDYDPTNTGQNTIAPKLFFRAIEFNPFDYPATGNLLSDEWERFYFGVTEVDQKADPDGDGLTNLQEYRLGTNPVLADTDGDGLPDGWEVHYGLDPKSAAAAPTDTDGDGRTDLAEYAAGTDPTNRADSASALPPGGNLVLSAPDAVYYKVNKTTGAISATDAP
ncbi:MAG: hypothetical protein HZA32_02645 [Opitutae bacterium]|nr:hypothetical protein [Opitutae bacterium]